MNTNRVEAFSDGVIAIIITIMVLELKIPHHLDLQSVREILPVLFSHVLSFLYVGIYWNNHHHLFHVCEKVAPGMLWANLHLLFWLSMVPFATAVMGENKFDPKACALYAIVLLMATSSYEMLQQIIIEEQPANSTLRAKLSRDYRGRISLVLYFIAAMSTILHHWVSIALIIATGILWLAPDKRIEEVLGDGEPV